tara:strand:- start:780 stop:1067 length:288 start_codon:yes stop_codon:yes gene_type:complete
MNESKRLELIRNAVANADQKVSKDFAGLLNDLKAEKLAGDLVVEHGLLEATQSEVQDEFVSLDAVEREEVEDFDSDENLVDMEQVSDSMREIFGE